MTRLTQEERQAIFDAYAAGKSSILLGNLYGVHPAYIRTLYQRMGGTDRPGSERRPRKVHLVKDFAERNPGLTVKEVAESTGVCLASVHNAIRRYNLDIKVFKSGRRKGQKIAHIPLPEAVVPALEKAARDRHCSIHSLIASMIDAVVADGIIDAVLDDREAA